MRLLAFGGRRAGKLRRQGNQARDAHRWGAAADAFRRYLALEPRDFAIAVQLGHALTELGDYPAADEAYRAAAALDGRDADLLLCWGHSRKRAGDVDHARELYAAAHAIDGEGPARGELEAIGPAAEPEPEPEPTPAVGRVESVEAYTIRGIVAAEEAGERVDILLDRQLVGQTHARDPRGPGLYAFEVTPEIDRHVRPSAVRASDGAELEGSPFHMGPPPPNGPRLAWSVRHQVVKPFRMPPGGEVALFVTHTPNGAIKPHVPAYLQALRDEGIAVLLIAVTNREVHIRPDVLDGVAGAIVRENAGYDFAAWAHAVHLHPEVYGASLLYLLNDSVVGPANGGRFGRLIGRVRKSRADLVGLTESQEYRWHLQTFFLALKPRLLSATRLHRFFAETEILADKDAVIRRYELGFAPEMEAAGHRIEVLFPSPAALNPALHDWRGLLAQGFPFMKLLLLRGHFPEADTDGWRKALRQADFDMGLIEVTLRAAEEQVPHDGSDRLYAHPLHHSPDPGRPLKIAFYGPWNYDNGLGVASRNTIAALRRTGARLNLHPIKKPFHVHRPIGPAVDVTEFEGAADVAIVHLNPDSWFLLTDEQRDAVRGAGKRIGYWVWEMDRLPAAWAHDFSSVDRIWSPSRYCADVFAGADQAPVDVIPHAVPIPAPAAVARADALATLGLPADARVILYLFDGSSYLVRKNPAALVRAFAASGLAARGWSLVLKTKHLMDRPEDGRRFRDLADGTPGVVLIDRALTASALADLWAAADIYASPHCSEGFGLTVAEAMAAGKPVVATDFSGTADVLDAETGYPVKAHAWRLDEDYGHYLAGFAWARIDEPALTATLLRAAADVEGGDRRRAEAGQARVAATLSFQAVADRINDSLEALFTRRGASPRVERSPIDLSLDVRFEEADLGPGIVAVPLGRDGSPAEQTQDLPDDRDSWIVFAPEGTLAAPLFGAILRNHAHRRPDVSIFYADDVAAETAEPVDELRLKPEFDQTLLAAQDYVGAPVMVRASALATLGGPDPAAGTAAIGDLLFRAQAAGLSIARIPRVLLAHPGERVRATPADHLRMVEAQPAFADHEVKPGLTSTTTLVTRRFEGSETPPVTIAIPTRRTPLPDGTGTYLERLLGRLAEVDWPMDRLHVLIGDDIAGEPEWASRAWPFQLRRIETPRGAGEPFNYAAKMNRLWRAAGTEQLLFLNDDARPIGAGWLRALQTFAVQPSVGGVGARLLFEDGSLQHAGLAPHGDGLAHPWIHRRRREGSYQDWALTQREWSMVTGAVFATRRSVMEEVNGFDERFSLEFNDTDLCLRLRALGYRIVCTPAAEMIHTEKASRGERLPPGEDLALFRSMWGPWIAEDPAWHPHLRRDRLDVTPAPESSAWYLRR